MKLKKTLILFGLLVTLGGSTTPFLVSKIQANNNDIILVNNEKVNLRKKAINKANNTTEANIETTNVDYDLRYLFGGEKNYLKYNIWNLKPTSTNSKDTSFKFICAKPVGTNLYLYVYHNDNRNGDILSATFNISKSKVQNQETGEFEENFARYNARFINFYGYKERFMKFAIDNIISTTEDIRCYIQNCYITYRDTSSTKIYYSNTYDVNDEFAFNVGSGSDFMYQYFKDDYITITDKEVSLLLTNKDITFDGNCAQTAYEDTYCFFNSDKDIQELLEVEYMYQTINYEADTKAIWNTMLSTLGSGGTPNNTNTDIYRGLYNNSNNDKNGFGGNFREVYGFTELEVSSYIQKNLKAEKQIQSVERPFFLWWTQNKSYELKTIQDCLDTSNLTGDNNKGFKEFIENVQNNRVTNNKSKFQWCFKVDSSIRELTNVKRIGGWWIFGGTYHSYTKCHEVKQVKMLRLKYRTNNQEFDFNCLDIPTDTTSIYIQNVPYETLGDIIINKTLSGWNWFKNAFNNIKNNLVPLLISLAVIVAIVACWPIITSFTKLVGASINLVNDKKVKKKSKNKKE